MRLRRNLIVSHLKYRLKKITLFNFMFNESNFRYFINKRLGKKRVNKKNGQSRETGNIV